MFESKTIINDLLSGCWYVLFCQKNIKHNIYPNFCEISQIHDDGLKQNTQHIFLAQTLYCNNINLKQKKKQQIFLMLFKAYVPLFFLNTSLDVLLDN